MFETAPSFRALLIFIEHRLRFYGQSMPFGSDKNIAYQNSSTLGYLSSTQALADCATLITDLKKNLSATDSPVVVFGGVIRSCAAGLSFWCELVQFLVLF
ncbi:putative serine protease pcp-1 [Camellia lanceoleosa]|uniref:Serine protease pcp-1 n=1 Tax=Camellia lanceoleosa TaxID=1840588 RepID=A0ACC0FQ50_9ERIC|nr:putative serine protease pcp-1 [Camellia lanceoleosa]